MVNMNVKNQERIKKELIEKTNSEKESEAERKWGNTEKNEFITENWNEEDMKSEKIWFSRENAVENIIQCGYQISSDTMLWNMTSMEGMT